MIICGIKVTHDGGISLIDDGVLKCLIEMEKLENNGRYASINDLSEIEALLQTKGYSIDQIDHFVVDGWHGNEANWGGAPMVVSQSDGERINLPVAGYNEKDLNDNNLQPEVFSDGLVVNGKSYPYLSYRHATGHIMGTYCASPFAERGEDSYVLVWDGGQHPRLYYVDASSKTVSNRGPLFFLMGTIYGIMGQYFGPYKKTDAELEEDRNRMELDGYFGGLSIAGKIMSYIAKGTVQPALLEALPALYQLQFEVSNLLEHKFCKAIRDFVQGTHFSDADVLLTLHTYLQDLLISNLKKKIDTEHLGQANFCFCGGSALNIKWNSTIRASGMFQDMFVPPFPNDSGSSLGAACAAMWDKTNHKYLQWHPYLGPDIVEKEAVEGWKKQPFDIEQLAHLLHVSQEPIVFLSGNAEIGPRALGHRSILAAATSTAMKARLNNAKKRESFRPVAPICLAEDAPEIFDPGSPDPHMLFEHQVKPAWRDKVSTICHLDGSARLQTVSAQSKAIEVRSLLEAYKEISGIPLLCNTSANFNGSGFFPDAESATRWGRVNYVWQGGFLYSKTNLPKLNKEEELEEIRL